jgi:hypothetical protein
MVYPKVRLFYKKTKAICAQSMGLDPSHVPVGLSALHIPFGVPDKKEPTQRDPCIYVHEKTPTLQIQVSNDFGILTWQDVEIVYENLEEIEKND